MYVEHVKCTNCGRTYAKDEVRFRCQCGGSLDVVYDYQSLSDIDWELLDKRPFSQFRYREFYPVVKDKHIVSLGEGGTPLLPARQLANELGIDDLWFKLEGMNPTASFKDRGTAVEISKALEFGANEVVVASTGNMGASIAAYSARTGIEAKIYVPRDVPETKLKQMKSYGATVEEVDGDYSLAADMARNYYEQGNAYLMGDYPYRGEGEKSLGFELVDQITPDQVLLPIGNGTLMKGTWKGFKEFETVDLSQSLPGMVGVQAKNCSTVVKAFNELEKEELVGKDELTIGQLKQHGINLPQISDPETIAGAIACGKPLDGWEALHALVESGGTALSVSDKEIIKAQELLAEKGVIYAEESGAVSLAGLIRLAEEGRLNKRQTIVVVITGHGLKT